MKGLIIVSKWLLLFPVAVIGWLFGTLAAYLIVFVSLWLSPYEALSYRDVIQFLGASDFQGLGYMAGIWSVFLLRWGGIMGAMMAATLLFEDNPRPALIALAVPIILLSLFSIAAVILLGEGYSAGYWVRGLVEVLTIIGGVWFAFKNLAED